jgi:hypothetical protein
MKSISSKETFGDKPGSAKSRDNDKVSIDGSIASESDVLSNDNQQKSEKNLLPTIKEEKQGKKSAKKGGGQNKSNNNSKSVQPSKKNKIK